MKLLILISPPKERFYIYIYTHTYKMCMYMYIHTQNVCAYRYTYIKCVYDIMCIYIGVKSKDNQLLCLLIQDIGTQARLLVK